MVLNVVADADRTVCGDAVDRAGFRLGDEIHDPVVLFFRQCVHMRLEFRAVLFDQVLHIDEEVALAVFIHHGTAHCRKTDQNVRQFIARRACKRQLVHCFIGVTEQLEFEFRAELFLNIFRERVLIIV